MLTTLTGEMFFILSWPPCTDSLPSTLAGESTTGRSEVGVEETPPELTDGRSKSTDGRSKSTDDCNDGAVEIRPESVPESK